MHDLESEELDDHRAARYALIGVPIGFVLVFGLTLGGCLLAGPSLGASALIALWPALVGGPFIGGVFGMSKLVLELEHRGEPVKVVEPSLHPYGRDHAHAA